jgi:hypothetical protein
MTEQFFKYRIKPSYWIVSIPVALILIPFGVMLIMAGLRSLTITEQFVPLAFGLLFVIFPFFGLVLAWMRSTGSICVVCNNEGVRIKNLFRMISANWEEILEFGTYKTGFGANPELNRVYYLKARKYGGRRIRVCGKTLQDLDQLIDIIFQNAVNAKFLREENVAIIPFTKKLRIDHWERN